jgi:hypothetical protein
MNESLKDFLVLIVYGIKRKNTLKWFILIFLLLSSMQANAQLQGQERIDSLEGALKVAKNDTNKVNLLQQLSFYLYMNDPDKGIEYGF